MLGQTTKKAVDLARKQVEKHNEPLNLSYNDPKSFYHTFDRNFEENVANLAKYANGRDVRKMNLISFNTLIDLAEKQNKQDAKLRQT